jgi:hypothetical protein
LLSATTINIRRSCLLNDIEKVNPSSRLSSARHALNLDEARSGFAFGVSAWAAPFIAPIHLPPRHAMSIARAITDASAHASYWVAMSFMSVLAESSVPVGTSSIEHFEVQ